MSPSVMADERSEAELLSEEAIHAKAVVLPRVRKRYSPSRDMSLGFRAPVQVPLDLPFSVSAL